MTWKHKLKADSLEMAIIDRKRFFHRKAIIIDIIKTWLSRDSVIICLQEVSKEILKEILMLKHTNCNVFYNVCDNMVKNDIMLTIIVKNCNVVSCSELYFDKKRSFLKLTANNLNIYNVHIHWKWSNLELKHAGKIIYESIDKEKYVICGDMNNTLVNIEPFLDEFDCIRSNNNVSYTGIDTKTFTKEAIDHIFVSASMTVTNNVRVISKVKNYKIIYNINKLTKMFGKITYKKWIKYRKNKDISDHKPVYLLLDI